jgi:hypothetical protein
MQFCARWMFGGTDAWMDHLARQLRFGNRVAGIPRGVLLCGKLQSSPTLS